jgi:hypothetical protein
MNTAITAAIGSERVADMRRAAQSHRRARHAAANRGFQAFVQEQKRLYKRQARTNLWGTNAISMLLVASGAAVGLTGMAGHLSDELNASLGVAVILLEGANRVFMPAQRAARAQRTAHDLNLVWSRWDKRAKPYCCSTAKQYEQYKSRVFEILERTYAEEDHDLLNGHLEPRSSDDSEGDQASTDKPRTRSR